MSLEDNKAKARAFITATINGEIRGDMLSDDFVFWNATTGELSRETVLQLPDALKRALKDGLKVEETGITAEGNRVAIEARSHGELVTGEAYSNVYHFLVEFAPDGLISRMHEHLDTASAAPLLRALGLLNDPQAME